MAGLVVKVLVKNGIRVEEGQPILVLEVMKMEVCIEAYQNSIAYSLTKGRNFLLI